MKKLFALIFAVLISASAFAENYFNVTTGFLMGGRDYSDDFGFQLNGEYFRTMNDSSFGLGLKIGGSFGYAGTTSISYDAEGFVFAPCLGWAFGETTKKKITIYPVALQYFNLTNGESDDFDTSVKIEDGSLAIIKTGASFSWQWGTKYQNGFEIGFDIQWNSSFKIGDEKVDDSAGVDIFMAYKFSLPVR